MTLRAAIASAALAATLLLTACGQKGPLYLPEDADTTPEAAETEPAPEPEPSPAN